jgi:hypothetical protein
MAAVAGDFCCVARVFAVGAAVLGVLIYVAIAGWMGTLLDLIHIELSPPCL